MAAKVLRQKEEERDLQVKTAEKENESARNPSTA